MAVRLILTREASPAHLARDLGIGLSTLSRWLREAIDQSPYGDVLKSLHDEVGVLRKENAALQRILAGRDARSGVRVVAQGGFDGRPRGVELPVE